ncbi:MAG: DUF72 domain-containing protein [Planctomycetaceae bacterium]
MIRIGPAGWSYQDWDGIVFPPKKGSKFDPLAYLSEFFDTIELNNTFYRPPTPAMSKSWARRVQSNSRFKFTAKLYRNFTHARESLTEADEGAFKNGLAPLVEAGRLGALLFQFPYSFHNKEENLAYVKELADRFKEFPLVLEVRHASWDRASAFQFLREIQVGFCNIDQPQVSYSLGPTKTVTSKTGYLRLHGRNVKEWFREDAGRDARYDYLYNEFELFEIAERIRQIGKEAEEVYVITNNHYRGEAVCNALELKAKLGEKNPKIPEILLEHYPRLKELKEEKGDTE